MARADYEAKRYVNQTCDAAGFTSLFALSCGDLFPIDLSVFSDSSGRLHRSPDHTACWNYDLTDDENEILGNKAGFSKDHLLMRMVGAWVQKDLQWVNQFIDYGNAHSWEICHAATPTDYLGRCIASPGLVELLRAMQSRLNGLALADIPEILIPNDFEAHLRMLAIWLKGQVNGSISDIDNQTIKAIAERERQNALYQAIVALYSGGDMTRVYELLGDELHWPKDHLPNNHDNHCTDYLYQRDFLSGDKVNPDWLPCPNEDFVTHPATEFGLTMFIAGAK
jgi:hypothetical protein